MTSALKQVLLAAGFAALMGSAHGQGDVNFGDDESMFAMDSECDDSRFIGDGMAEPPFFPEDIGHDASDCQSAFQTGSIRLRTEDDPPPDTDMELDELLNEYSDLLDAIAETVDPTEFDPPPENGVMYDGINFGDNTSEWADDNECDDPRFSGIASADGILSAEDAYHDANDCLNGYQTGGLDLVVSANVFELSNAALEIDFGDDAGSWPNDNECDDPRFSGPGMAQSDLLDSDIGHDASDCETAFKAGRISLIETAGALPDGSGDGAPATSGFIFNEIDFGTDEGEWVFDDECDDPRFIGEGMAGILSDDDIKRDASDCLSLYKSGAVRLRGPDDPEAEDEGVFDDVFDEMLLGSGNSALYDDPPADGVIFNGVNFGDNSSEWANDGECDDPRFKGEGQTDSMLLASDAYHDADDCLAAWKEGGLELAD